MVRIKSLTDNKMTFFSGTDTATLQEEGSYKNNFVSLIVNNAGSYTAAITRHVYKESVVNSSFTYEMFGDGTVAGSETGTEKREFIEYFMMDIHKPDIQQNALDTRINEILDKKRKSATKSYSTWYQGYNDRTAYDIAKEKKKTESVFPESTNTPSKQISIPWKEKEFTVKPTHEGVNKDALKVTLARLLTSNMTCNPYNLDIDSWIDNYDKVYAAKFMDLVDYSEWLAPYLEYLMYHIPGTPTDIIDDLIVEAYANEMIKKIGKPKGIFSKELIDQLSFYGTDVTHGTDIVK